MMYSSASIYCINELKLFNIPSDREIITKVLIFINKQINLITILKHKTSNSSLSDIMFKRINNFISITMKSLSFTLKKDLLLVIINTIHPLIQYILIFCCLSKRLLSDIMVNDINSTKIPFLGP